MNMIYTVTVHMSQRVEFMGGKLMYANIAGERVCQFSNVDEADRFATMMKDKGYEVEIGIVKATAEAWAAEVAATHAKLGNGWGHPVLDKAS